MPARKKPAGSRLTERSLRTVGPGRHGDGHGLHLFVRPSGTRSWVQRIVIGGQRYDLGLGGHPLVSLTDARDVAFRESARRALGRRSAGVSSWPGGAHSARRRRGGHCVPSAGVAWLSDRSGLASWLRQVHLPPSWRYARRPGHARRGHRGRPALLEGSRFDRLPPSSALRRCSSLGRGQEVPSRQPCPSSSRAAEQGPPGP